MTDKELDDLFQHKLSGHRMPVPPGMWERVNPQENKRRRGAFLWWSVLGIAAFFIITGTAIWLYQAPSQSRPADQAKQTKTPASGLSTEHKTVLPQQPVSATNEVTAPVTNSGASSSQTASVNTIAGHQKRDSYTNQNKAENRVVTSAGVSSDQKNMATINRDKNITRNHSNTLLNSGNNNQNTITASSDNNTQNNNTSLPSEPGKPMDSSGDKSIASIQKPDSSNASSAKNPTAQTAKAATVKGKKIHSEKTPALELMVAGYGNSRNVYDQTSQLRTNGVIAFGPINTKEKVLMHSIGITARINKPLTKNLSIKTGLQFLQTRQATSYTYETVNQTMTINSLSTDTTVFARLQSRQSEIKGTYNSFSVPVLMSYHTNAARVSFGATTGVLINVLSWYEGRVPDAGNGQVAAAKNVFRAHTGTSLYAGLTAARQVGSFQIFAEPHIQYSLSSITKNSASFRQKITGYGFGIGIRKTIGK